MDDPEFTDFWQLLGYQDAITPEIQRAALAAEVFWPCEIYDHAPADVRDGLIHARLSAEYSSAASNLMSKRDGQIEIYSSDLDFQGILTEEGDIAKSGRPLRGVQIGRAHV